jgi:hypothetical protein
MPGPDSVKDLQTHLIASASKCLISQAIRRGGNLSIRSGGPTRHRCFTLEVRDWSEHFRRTLHHLTQLRLDVAVEEGKEVVRALYVG